MALALYYSVTANPYEPLLNFIGRYVDGFRVVSRGELERLKRAELAGIPMTFAGPGKGDDELEAGIAAGATISVESEGEARRAILAGRAARHPPQGRGPGQSALRDRERPDDDGRSAEPVRHRRASACRRVVRGLIEAGVDWRGLHIFAAAQCLDASALIDAHKAIIACAGDIADELGMPLPELNLGGGFDVPCFAGEQPLDIYSIASALHETLCDGPELLATTRLSLELGRWLVGRIRRLSDPRPRPHRELRGDLPHHRRGRPPSAPRDRLSAGAQPRQLSDRRRQPLRCAERRAGNRHRLPRNPIRRARRRSRCSRTPSPAT